MRLIMVASLQTASTRAGATEITTEMKRAASDAVASLVSKHSADNVVPSALDGRVTQAVSMVVAEAWK